MVCALAALQHPSACTEHLRRSFFGFHLQTVPTDSSAFKLLLLRRNGKQHACDLAACHARVCSCCGQRHGQAGASDAQDRHLRVGLRLSAHLQLSCFLHVSLHQVNRALDHCVAFSDPALSHDGQAATEPDDLRVSTSTMASPYAFILPLPPRLPHRSIIAVPIARKRD